MLKESLENSIFLHKSRINELEKIKNAISKSEGENIRFKIETKHWYGYSTPSLSKDKSILDISKETMEEIIDTAIQRERDLINKCIDMEIELRQKKEEL